MKMMMTLMMTMMMTVMVMLKRIASGHDAAYGNADTDDGAGDDACELADDDEGDLSFFHTSGGRERHLQGVGALAQVLSSPVEAVEQRCAGDVRAGDQAAG